MRGEVVSRRTVQARAPALAAGRWGVGRIEVRPHLWKIVLGAGLVAIVLYFLLPGMLVPDLLYGGVGLATTISIVVGMRMHRVVGRTGWYLVAAATACYFGGDVVLDFYELVLRSPPPYPSLADLLYLSGYPFLFAGVLRITRAPGRTSSAWTDATAVSVGALGLLWNYLMGPTLRAPLDQADGSGTLGRLVTMIYPVMDLGVLWVVAAALLVGAARRTANRLLVSAVTCMLIADFGYDLIVLHGGDDQHTAADAGLLLAYVLMATAALHPSVGLPTVARHQPLVRSPGSLAPVAVAALISPAIMFLSGVTGLPIDLPVLATTSVVVFALMLLRVWRLLGQVSTQNLLLAQGSETLRGALVTQQLLQDDLRHRSLHDDLTGLANRTLLQENLAQALGAAGARHPVALCVCDLDEFKAVNDSLGHQVGDQLLVVVAKRLTSVLHGQATVARLGGDEFAILLEDLEQPEAAIALAERIVSVLRETVHLPDHDLRVAASVGVAVGCPGATAATMLSEADAAMYEAKSAGKNRVALFENSMRSKLLEKTSMVNCFPGALQRSEFVLAYQPQFGLRAGRLEGFECLVRWQHPTLGLIGPNRFIPLAEETRFILPLGRWILQAACAEAAAWQVAGDVPLTVAVNVSGWQVQEADFLDTVREALRCSGLAPYRLVLEVTESVLMADPAGMAEVLRSVRRLGVLVAIDDFGTGFSSLSHLRQLPADILKIDKSFIDPLLDPLSEGDAFVATIVRLADDLGLATVAEGIEHRTQLDALVRLGCHSGQGYLVAAPFGAAAARRFIDAGTAVSRIPGTLGDSLLPQA